MTETAGNNSNSGILELNVGGVFYTSNLATLRRQPDSLLAAMFSDSAKAKAVKDAKGKYFIDRDGVLFRYILDYLRNLRLVLPENFHEKERLRQESEYYRLPALTRMLDSYPGRTTPIFNKDGSSNNGGGGTGTNNLTTTTTGGKLSIPQASIAPSTHLNKQNSGGEDLSATISPAPSPLGERGPGFITVGYRGTFAFGRDGLADVKFRKLSRIVVCGKVSLCREVFKDTLNESRDPDRGDSDRYTSRFFLKHTFLEQAFDMLQDEGFVLVASCGSGTNSAGEVKPGLDTEEAKWQHYNEFIFERR